MNAHPGVNHTKSHGEFFERERWPFDDPKYFFSDLDMLARDIRVFVWTFWRVQGDDRQMTEVAELFLERIYREVGDLASATPLAETASVRARREFEGYKNAVKRLLPMQGHTVEWVDHFCRVLDDQAARYAATFDPLPPEARGGAATGNEGGR